MSNNRSVFKKLIFYNLPIAIIPFLVILVLFFRYTCINIKNEERNHMQDMMDSYVQNIDIAKSNAVLKTDYITDNSELIEWLEATPTTLDSQLILLEKITGYATVINGSNANLITVYTNNPYILPSRFTDQLSALPNTSAVMQNLAVANHMFLDETLHYDEQELPYLALYRKITSQSDIVVLSKVYLPEDTTLFVAIDDGVYRNDDVYITRDITEKLVAVAPLDTQKLMQQYLRYGLVFILIGLVFCAIIFFATVTVTTKTTQTINAFILDLSGRDILEHDDIETISTTDSMELHVIKKALNQLIAKVKEGKDMQYQAELEKKRLELDLLQSKIDPHILYNSLATISHKAFKNNDREIFDIIKNLTSYYRLVLAQGKDFTALAEELNMIQKFICVNEISHSQTYHYTEQVDSALLNQPILHLSLQPFIENSIVHGLAGKQQPCEIRLSCYCKDGFLFVEIFDNGYGMTEEKCHQLNNLHDLNGSYGIKNTFDRLRLFYGNDCHIQFESEFGKYTKVTLQIPQQPIDIKK